MDISSLGTLMTEAGVAVVSISILSYFLYYIITLHKKERDEFRNDIKEAQTIYMNQLKEDRNHYREVEDKRHEQITRFLVQLEKEFKDINNN